MLVTTRTAYVYFSDLKPFWSNMSNVYVLRINTTLGKQVPSLAISHFPVTLRSSSSSRKCPINRLLLGSNLVVWIQDHCFGKKWEKNVTDWVLCVAASLAVRAVHKHWENSDSSLGFVPVCFTFLLSVVLFEQKCMKQLQMKKDFKNLHRFV